MDKFDILHKYNRLVRRDLAEPLTCTDGFEYTVKLGPDGDPVLHCYLCGGRLTPGEKMYAELLEVVEERLK